MDYCACLSSLRQYQHRLLLVQLRRVPLTLQEHLVTIAVAAVNEEGEDVVKIRWRKYHLRVKKSSLRLQKWLCLKPGPPL